MAGVAALWRHPIKSHGREALESVTLQAGQSMPWDRHWAVVHEDSKFNPTDPAWVQCRNFMITVSTPDLAGIWATLDDESRTITLTHQDIGRLTFCPDDSADAARFIEWVTPLSDADARKPTGIARLSGRGLTDSAYPTVSIMTKASHASVEGRLGRSLEPERWRGNIWLDGPAPWEEFDWIGKTLRIGQTVVEVKEPIQRCKATMANPATGKRDTDTLAILRDSWGHQNFGVYAEVIETGAVTLGDGYEVL